MPRSAKAVSRQISGRMNRSANSPCDGDDGAADGRRADHGRPHRGVGQTPGRGRRHVDQQTRPCRAQPHGQRHRQDGDHQQLPHRPPGRALEHPAEHRHVDDGERHQRDRGDHPHGQRPRCGHQVREREGQEQQPGQRPAHAAAGSSADPRPSTVAGLSRPPRTSDAAGPRRTARAANAAVKPTRASTAVGGRRRAGRDVPAQLGVPVGRQEAGEHLHRLGEDLRPAPTARRASRARR